MHARQQVKPVDGAITDEVTSIASSLIDDHIRLLVSTGGRTIVSYAMGDKIPFKVFELQLRDYLPRTVECLPDGKVLAFSMYDGVM